MGNVFSYDVFLSHNKADQQRVRRLAERLRTAGLRIWFDEWVIKPGDDIYLAVERGVEASRTFVLCMSSNAFGSDWVGLERSSVLFRDPSNAGRRFIPLLLADCELPQTLRRYKYVDFRRETPAAFEELLVGCRRSLAEASAGAPSAEVVTRLTENPKELVLITKKEMPQWADHWELNLRGKRMELLSCRISTASAYFRFGFKLLNEDGRLFGDGSIQSQDTNLVVHIGRNNWDRPDLSISAQDIFFTWYVSGVSIEEDKRLFSSEPRVTASLELRIDSSNVAAFCVNGVCCLRRVISPGIRHRVAALAWGDRNEYTVEVTDLRVATVPSP